MEKFTNENKTKFLVIVFFDFLTHTSTELVGELLLVSQKKLNKTKLRSTDSDFKVSPNSDPNSPSKQHVTPYSPTTTDGEIISLYHSKTSKIENVNATAKSSCLDNVLLFIYFDMHFILQSKYVQLYRLLI